jgi:hypothetical protein
MKKGYRYLIFFFIVAISLIEHYKHFPKDLMSIHVWRQTQTQSTIINFYEEDMNILNPRRNDRGDGEGLFRLEFPLMQWLVACLYKVFGNHLIICRIFMFMIGLLSVLGIYKLLFALFHNQTLSLFGAWAFNFSPSFYYYTINPMPDNFALCCSIWGMALFFMWYAKNNMKLLASSGLLLSIGALCKLPFIIFFIVPLVHFIILFRKSGISKKTVINALVIHSFLILPFSWYAATIPRWHGSLIVKGILANQESMSTIIEYLRHNLISTLPELLLNYGSVPFFLAGFYFLFKRKAYKDPKFHLIFAWGILVLLYYLFEVNAVAKIHDYYLFPFYPLLFILAGYGAYHLFISKKPIIRYFTIILLMTLPVTAYLRIHGRWDPSVPGFNKDLLVYKNELQLAVPKNSLVVAGNDESHFIFFYYIDKKGWSFQKDQLTADKLKSMINKGAEYLYTDSRAIDGNKEITCLLDTLLLEKGTIRIYSLRNLNP